ncbi:TadE/TadG family type IV pilus assembly protein [Myxococcus sp. 1LA]
MLTRSIRQSFRRQEGQALVLAALMVLIMSLAVLATVNIGHTVHERIRLQNTADAAAYSMAAMEARAFNFYAYANRTQVSHYVSAMMWQSLLSLIYSAEAFLTDLYGLMRTMNPCAGSPSGYWRIVCPILQLVPIVGPLLRVVSRVMTLYRDTFLRLVQTAIKGIGGLNPDVIIGQGIIPAHRVLNGVMYFASQAVMLSASTHVVQSSQSVVAANDSNLNSMMSQLATGVYSQCLFSQAHSPHAGGRPLSPASWKNPFGALDPTKRAKDDPVARAKRSMGGITNATRYACDTASSGGLLECPQGFVTSRRMGELLPIPDMLGFLKDFLSDGVDVPGVMQFGKIGQTRMLTSSFPNARSLRDGSGPGNTGRNYIRDWNDNLQAWGMMAQGDNLGSDDPYWINIGPAEIGSGPFKIDNPLACTKNDDYWKCFGDNRRGKGDNNTSKLPYKHMMKTSIWALNDEDSGSRRGGLHWRVNYSNFGQSWGGYVRPSGPEGRFGIHETEICVVRLGACLLEANVYAANVRPVQDGNHRWPGLVPFMHFEPGQFGSVCNPAANANIREAAPRTADFNQPSTWVAMNKSLDEIINRQNADGSGSNAPALLNNQGKVTFAFSPESEGLEMMNNRKKFLGMAEGLNVISRGQAYYHRPGNWAEQPNFFNPYWRPRLASVYQGRHSLPAVGSMLDALPGPLRGIAPKIVTH